MAEAAPVPLDGYIGRSRQEALRELAAAGLEVEAVDTAVPGPLALLLRLGGAPAVPSGARVRALVAADRVVGFATSDPELVRADLAELSARLGRLEARVDALEGGDRRRRTRRTTKPER
jgi:hypothetical protein